MELIIGVPLLVSLVPLCLVLAFRHTRGWWLPGAGTFAAGLVMFLVIMATQTGSRHGGDLPLFGLADLAGIFGMFLMLWGAICFVIGALTSGAGRRERHSADQPAVDLSPAYVVVRRRT
jgi:hypothetical protein